MSTTLWSTAEAARLTAFSKGDLSNATPPEQLVRSNAEMPMMMFQDVGHAAYGLPGRKALVWVTNAVPFDIDPKTFNFVSPKETQPWCGGERSRQPADPKMSLPATR